MSKHTPEPWIYHRQGFSTVYVEARIGGGLLQEIAACGPCQDGQEQQEENARRIVACVNACAGLSTDELERFGIASAFGSEIVELKNQRDELLAALSSASEKMKSAHESMFEQCLSNPVSNAWGKEINLSAINELQLAASRIDSAIAKAKGVEA